MLWFWSSKEPALREILDLAEHLHADAPAAGELVFGAPAILEAEAVGLAVVADLGGEERD